MIDHHFARLVKLLAQRRARVGAAESLTGGLFGYLLTREEGSGDVFRGSLVTYQTQTKRDLLGVAGPVISAATAETMAGSALKQLAADIAVGLTGVAGPDTQEGKPVGTVFIAAASADDVLSREFHFEGNPDEIRHQAANQAAALAVELLESHD
ncbi:MAG TPA: CinA family protein [Acidimicrobiia bacterium]